MNITIEVECHNILLHILALSERVARPYPFQPSLSLNSSKARETYETYYIDASLHFLQLPISR